MVFLSKTEFTCFTEQIIEIPFSWNQCWKKWKMFQSSTFKSAYLQFSGNQILGNGFNDKYFPILFTFSFKWLILLLTLLLLPHHNNTKSQVVSQRKTNAFRNNQTITFKQFRYGHYLRFPFYIGDYCCGSINIAKKF